MAMGQAVYGLAILAVVFWYSSLVFKMTDEYFRGEFKKHLRHVDSNEQRRPMYLKNNIENNIRKNYMNYNHKTTRNVHYNDLTCNNVYSDDNKESSLLCNKENVLLHP